MAHRPDAAGTTRAGSSTGAVAPDALVYVAVASVGELHVAPVPVTNFSVLAVVVENNCALIEQTKITCCGFVGTATIEVVVAVEILAKACRLFV